MESILKSIKELLGIPSEVTHFDSQLIMHINSVFLPLNQIGIGPESGYLITGEGNLWSEFLGDQTYIEAVKSYVYLKVRLIFDPPTNSFLIDSVNRQISEFEWRLMSMAESKNVTEGGGIMDE